MSQGGASGASDDVDVVASGSDGASVCEEEIEGSDADDDDGESAGGLKAAKAKSSSASSVGKSSKKDLAAGSDKAGKGGRRKLVKEEGKFQKKDLNKGSKVKKNGDKWCAGCKKYLPGDQFPPGKARWRMKLYVCVG